ncbi:MAG TPA: tRNA pseudouridine(38-40) synthase TruA [bacterium (Candidatus Stahlbacteria)]|nr:tRNA pseudouridine(38-40) synthase TruA [Candidatus Stahlbacteria bacterium]
MRYKFLIAYDGTDYHGWQVQREDPTIQGEIEGALASVFNKRIRVVGAGRTDAGVHALGQVAHTDLETDLNLDTIRTATNANLPRSIRILKVEQADPDFHARLSARSKIYRYQITYSDSPFKRRYFWQIPYQLDIKTMEGMMPKLIGKRDFSSLAGNLEGRSPICRIMRIDLTMEDDDLIIEVEGDRFLPQMVRRIIGFLTEVGRGKEYPDEISRLGETIYKIAPPQGLFLFRVIY